MKELEKLRELFQQRREKMLKLYGLSADIVTASYYMDYASAYQVAIYDVENSIKQLQENNDASETS